MNIATLIGFIFGTLIFSVAIFQSTENPDIFWNAIGLAVVLGGVTAATFICYPFKKVIMVFVTFIKVLKPDDIHITNYIAEIHHLAQLSISGTAKLEKSLTGIKNYFLKDAVRMVVDQYPTESIRHVLSSTITQTRKREYREAAVFRSMAKFSPAFGMIGTLIGLIVMFQGLNQNDMGGIGGAMAVAMMTTFYGILMANLLFLPIAIKLEDRIEERTVLMTVIMEGIILVAKKTPPPLVLDELKAYLPPRRWTDIKTRTIKNDDNK